MLNALRNHIKRLVTSDHGTVSIELVLMFPLLIFVLTSTIVYFDGFRSKFALQKTTTTVADTISRELTLIGPDYIDGLADLFQVLTPGLSNRGMRLSVISYNEEDDEHNVVWSQVRGVITETIEDEDLLLWQDRFPLMADLERYVVVETTGGFASEFDDFFGSALGYFQFADFVTISPRFNRTVCFDDGVSIDPAC